MMKSCSILAAVLALVACSPKSNSKENVTQYSSGIDRGVVIGLDVRSQGEYKSNGSSEAKNIPIDTLASRLDELDKDKEILVFCESGGRASKAKKILEDNGFSQVTNIKDWRAWNQILQSKERK